MTLDDLERQNRGLLIFCRFQAARHNLRANCAEIEIEKDKLRMKFSVLNVNFEGPSLDFLGSRKPAY